MKERDTLTSTDELHTHTCANRGQSLEVYNRLLLKTWREYELKGEEKEPGLGGQKRWAQPQRRHLQPCDPGQVMRLSESRFP